MALSHSAQTYTIPQSYFQDVINGVEMDLTKNRYASFEELRLYCYRVASVVGLICLEIFGYKDPKARGVRRKPGSGYADDQHSSRCSGRHRAGPDLSSPR